MITRRVGDETAGQGALQQAAAQPALEQSLGVNHNPVDEWQDTAVEGATHLEICVKSGCSLLVSLTCQTPWHRIQSSSVGSAHPTGAFSPEWPLLELSYLQEIGKSVPQHATVCPDKSHSAFKSPTNVSSQVKPFPAPGHTCTVICPSSLALLPALCCAPGQY